MSECDRTRWDEKYAGQSVPRSLEPDEWLVQCAAGLPKGRALDLACGLGHNAIWLAQQGWTVDAIDISPTGITLATKLANNQQQQVNWIVEDLDDHQAPTEFYDLIIVFRFLDRNLIPKIVRSALAPGGHLVYETFSSKQLERRDNHLKNPAFTLQPGELAALFSELEPIAFHEVELDDRAVARLFARKPA